MVCKQIIIKISGEIPPDIPDDDNDALIIIILAVVALIFVMRS